MSLVLYLRLVGVALLVISSVECGTLFGSLFLEEDDSLLDEGKLGVDITLENADAESTDISGDGGKNFSGWTRLEPGATRVFSAVVGDGDSISWVARRNGLRLDEIQCVVDGIFETEDLDLKVRWDGARLECVNWSEAEDLP